MESFQSRNRKTEISMIFIESSAEFIESRMGGLEVSVIELELSVFESECSSSESEVSDSITETSDSELEKWKLSFRFPLFESRLRVASPSCPGVTYRPFSCGACGIASEPAPGLSLTLREPFFPA